jgi:D-alanyl-D-alanine carboxypeptidase
MLLPVLLAAAVAASPAPPNPITAAVQRSIDFKKVPGAVVGVSRNGKLIYVQVFGKRNIAANEPVTAETAFEIGSMTKQFTAAAILRLQEAGKLSIDDKLSKYLPSFPHASEVTLRNLLNQTSGMPDYVDDQLLLSPAVSTEPTHAQLMARITGPLHFTPGTKWEYSNSNYLALGWVVERISGMSWEQYIRTNLFARAHMTHSGFFDDEPKMRNVATGYNSGVDDTGQLKVSPIIKNGWAGGAGAIVSTVADINAWNDALQNGRIVSAADYTLMTTPPDLPNKPALPYGMGLARDLVDGHVRIWHNGGTGGSHTMDACFPNDHICVIAFENTAGGAPEAVTTAVFEAVVPEASFAAAQAAPGEDAAVTARARSFYDQLMHNAIDDTKLTPEFEKYLTPELRAQIAAGLSQLGEPQRVIYKGETQDGTVTTYSYRFEYAASALMFTISIDSTTGLIAGSHLMPQ